MAKQPKLYGTWDSPITPNLMVNSLRISDAQWDSDGMTLVWAERRENGTRLVMQRGEEAIRDLTDGDFPIGGTIGYGGGDFTVSHGFAYIASKGRLYRLSLDHGKEQPITPAFGSCASPSASTDGKWIAYIHSYENQDALTLVDALGKQFPQKLASGSDFVMQPTWHPQGTHIAYIAWNFPNMPWNATELRLITLAYDKQGNPYNAIEEVLASGDDVALFQPQFSSDGRYLAYISDVSGWGHLYIYDLAEGSHKQITSGEHEHGYPAWIQGLRQFGWTGDSRGIYYTRNDKGVSTIWRYDLHTQTHSQIQTLSEYTHFSQITVSPKGERFAVLASHSTLATRLISHTATEGARIVRRSTSERIAPAQLANPDLISWTSFDGELAHGLYYAPTHPQYEGMGKPPLMVLVHGGPTSQRSAEYDQQVQFFATRGYAVLQVNHRGSTGYGKAYMNKQKHVWGVHDTEDSRTGALHLAEKGLVDASKMIIMGGSAGGFTVLMMLTQYPGVFKAGINLYGVSDQFTLALDANFKFESRYFDWLLGELPTAAPRWRESSPAHVAHKIKDPIIIFQGADDEVVPKSQSDAIVATLRRNGVPHEYYVYEGEGHGFGKPATIRDLYSKIERFLLQYVLYS